MTHAWLFTGPPGSGRSTAARAFAAALQCTSPDRALGGEPGLRILRRLPHHPDRHACRRGDRPHRPAVHRCEGDPRPGPPRPALPGRRPLAGHRPGGRRPADRRRGQCAAQGGRGARSAHGVAAVRALAGGRAAHHPLPLPPPDPAHPAGGRRRRRADPPRRHRPRAAPRAAARATQGHIGRARRLATDEPARARRAAVLQLPLRVDDVGGCLKAAQELVDAAAEDAKQVAEEVDAKETEDLRAALGAGAGTGGRMPRGTAGVMKELEDRQKRRRTRTQRDSLDLALTDLTGFYRDVLALQLGSRGHRQRGDTVRPRPDRARVGSRADPAPYRGGPRLPRRPGPQCGAAARGRGDDDVAARGLTRPAGVGSRGGAPVDGFTRTSGPGRAAGRCRSVRGGAGCPGSGRPHGPGRAAAGPYRGDCLALPGRFPSRRLREWTPVACCVPPGP